MLRQSRVVPSAKAIQFLSHGVRLKQGGCRAGVAPSGMVDLTTILHDGTKLDRRAAQEEAMDERRRAAQARAAQEALARPRDRLLTECGP